MRKFLCGILLLLPACAGTRYRMGYNAGVKDYNDGNKTGRAKIGYGLGWLQGFHDADQLHKIDTNLNKLKKLLEEQRLKPLVELEMDMDDEIDKETDELLKESR